MRVPERKLLIAMPRTERVVDVEDLLLARLHCRARLIDESCGEPRRLRLARRILQTADGRLRGQRRAGDRTAADRDLHQRVMPQPVEVDGILVAARDCCDPRHHHLEHIVPDAAALRRSGIASASRPHTPSLRSACRNSSRPPSEDWLPPAKSTVSFLRWTDGRSKGSGVASLMMAVALC